jgi:hypothetical protein
MLQLYHKGGGNSSGPVISEKYDEFVCLVLNKVFNSPSVPLLEALTAHSLDSLPRPKPSTRFSTLIIYLAPELEQEELRRIQTVHEKILAEYEIRKLELSRYEQELATLQEDVKILQMTHEK